MRRRIILPNNIEVVVVSYGGVGTTFLMDFLSKYKKLNASDNSDKWKHSPIPPICLNKKTKFVYIYGNPMLATVSLFRRNYHHHMSVMSCIHKGKNIARLPLEMTLEEYSLTGTDQLWFREHFYNWYEKYLVHPTLFIKYEKIFEAREQILDFLEIPKKAIDDFPKIKKRVSNLDNLSPEIKKGLVNLYGNFNNELNGLKDYELRVPKRQGMFPFSYIRYIYIKILIKDFFRGSVQRIKKIFRI